MHYLECYPFQSACFRVRMLSVSASTGDNIMVAVAVLLVSAAALVIVFLVKKKKK